MSEGPIPLPDLATVLGLAFGLLARIGYALDQGIGIQRRQIIGQFMMLGVCYAIAEAGCDVGQLFAPAIGSPTMRVLSAAGIALAASRAVSRLRESTEAKINARFPVPKDPEQPK